MERCGARRGTDSGGWYPCVLSKGHTAPIHMDHDSDTWRDDMGHCTVTNNEGHQCYLIPDHDQEHRFTSVRIACGTQFPEGPCAGTRGHRGDCTANADDIPSVREADECGARRREGDHDVWPCIRPSGHTGMHADKDGDRWSFPMLTEEMCGRDIDDSGEDRACRLNTGHDGEHRDGLTCGKPVDVGGSGLLENARPCEQSPGHTGPCFVYGGAVPAEPDTLTGRRTEDIIREMAERLTRLEEQPTLTELATSLGRIMERLNAVEENADRVVKIAENLRTHADSFEHGLGHVLREIIELLRERLPEPPAPRCGHRALSSLDLCELEEGHDGRHRGGNSSWPRGDGPQPCPVTVRANVSGSIPWNCTRPLGHGGMHSDSEGYTWTVSGI